MATQTKRIIENAVIRKDAKAGSSVMCIASGNWDAVKARVAMPALSILLRCWANLRSSGSCCPIPCR